MLILIAASEGITVLSEQKLFKNKISIPLCLTGTAAASVLIFAPYAGRFFHTETSHREIAVMQDMYDGNDILPLLSGETVTQTFRTDQPFNHVGVKVLNENRESNLSSYQMRLLDKNGSELAAKTFYGCDVWNKDYCYLNFPSVVPEKETSYQLEITAIDADETQHLTFPYYHSGNYNIYSDGQMYGLNSNEKSDLNFIVFDEVTKAFFN